MRHLQIYLTDRDPAWLDVACREMFPHLIPKGTTGHMQATGLRLLLSYHYFKNVDLDMMLSKFHHPQGQVFADSGAFSAKTLGAEVQLDKYAAWLKKWRHWWGAMANLDVIGDPDGTARNQSELEVMGLPVLPVFHAGSDFAVLDRLADRYDYIALGGMVGKQVKVLDRWIAKCHRTVGDRVRFHGFGMTSWPLMLKFPWRSVDSSSWGQGHRYGTLSIFDPVHGNWLKFRVGTVAPMEHARVFRQLGCDPLDFVDRRRYHASKAIKLAIRSWAKAADYMGRTTYLAGDTEFTAQLRRDACAAAFKETL